MKGLLVLVLAAAGIAAGCGEGVVPGMSYETPLFSLSGHVFPALGLNALVDPALNPIPRSFLVSVLWTDPLQRQPDVPAPARSARSSVDPVHEAFTLDLFRPPPPEALADIPSPGGAGSATMAVGEIVLVDDKDGDGTFRAEGPRAEIQPPDLYLAGSGALILYVARRSSAAAGGSPLGASGQIGFETVAFVCAGRVQDGTYQAATNIIDLYLQPSRALPEVRSCERTHSP